MICINNIVAVSVTVGIIGRRQDHKEECRSDGNLQYRCRSIYLYSGVCRRSAVERCIISGRKTKDLFWVFYGFPSLELAATGGQPHLLNKDENHILKGFGMGTEKI